MSGFPTSDEEFELTYGDELEILKEHEEFFESTSSNKENSSNINNSLILESQKNPVNTQLVTQSRKRTIEELFGDIDDLLLESTAKKYKEDGTLDRDQNIIQKILELREKNQSEQSLTLPNRELYKSREEDSISYSLPNFPHISVKTKDNQPYYIRYHSEEFMKEDVKRTISNCNLKETVVGGFESVWDEAQALINLQLDNEKTQNTQQETKLNACVDQAKQLWVDYTNLRAIYSF